MSLIVSGSDKLDQGQVEKDRVAMWPLYTKCRDVYFGRVCITTFLPLYLNHPSTASWPSKNKINEIIAENEASSFPWKHLSYFEGN